MKTLRSSWSLKQLRMSRRFEESHFFAFASALGSLSITIGALTLLLSIAGAGAVFIALAIFSLVSAFSLAMFLICRSAKKIGRMYLAMFALSTAALVIDAAFLLAS